MNCPYKQLLFFATARGKFRNSFPSPKKFLLNTDKIVSIEWLNLAPRQRICDCFEIHLPSLRTVICCHQVTKLFCSRYWISCSPSARSPHNLTSQFRSFGKWVWIQGFLDATFVGRSESESWEVFASAGTSASSRLSVNSSNQSGRSRNRSLVAWFLSSVLFLFLPFWGSPRSPDAWLWVSSLRNLAGLGEVLGKWVLMLCFLDFDTTFVGRSESESWEMCAGACNSVFSCYLWTPPTTKEDLTNGRPNLDCQSSFHFCLGFWCWSAPVSWGLSVTSLLSWTCWQILRCRCFRRIASRTGG